MDRIITKEDIKEISDIATEIFHNTHFTAVEALRVAKGMVDDERKKLQGR